MKKIPTKTYKNIIKQIPILCVDIVLKHRGEYLLVKRKNNPLKEEWWVPGGRIFIEEKAEEAVKRILKEELGIKAKILGSFGYFEIFFKGKNNYFGLKEKTHFVSIVFLAEPISLKVKLDGQSSDWKWADKLPKKFKINKFNN